MKRSNILYIFIECPEVENKENGIKAKFKNTTDKNVPELMKSNNSQFQEVHEIPNGKIKRHHGIIVELQKGKIKGKS